MQKLLSACFVVCLSLQSLTAQTSNAIVGGTITDDSGSRLPAVNVTATNTRTGISANANTNTDGIYTFPSLQSGVFSFSASLPGFITQSIRDVVLGSTQERINFKLSTASETQASLATGASSVSDVLSEDLTNRLPLVGKDAMGLLDSLPGIVRCARAHASRRQFPVVRSNVRRIESEQQRLGIWSCGNHLQRHASNRLITSAAEWHIRSFSGERQLS
jgi:Carboxypeptidase regulatory-like domain